VDSRCFGSADAYREAFAVGLREMLDGYDELGVFILVLANAMIDDQIWARLAAPLRRKFEHLAVEQQAARQGVSLDDARDDQRVFSQLMDIGFDQIGPIRLRNAGPWELQHNPLRSLRPARMVTRPVTGISAPFDPDQFHFARPFLRKETFWRGELAGRQVSLLYNKFPFVRLMGLLVPEIRDGHPQYLQHADHRYIWHLLDTLGETLPEIGVGFNSYGAYASVNHLHFHLFMRARPLPIAAADWSHNGGDLDYPAQCHRFDEQAEAWRFIQELHGRRTPYNLVCLPGRLYCLPRLPQGIRELPAWSGGFAWYEMAGCCVPQGESSFQALTADQLQAELAAVSAPAPS